MDKQKAIELLKQKSNEAAFLGSLHYENNEYLPWRRNIEDILESAFGLESSEYKRVAEIPDITGAHFYTEHNYKSYVARIHQEINSIVQKYDLFVSPNDNDKNVSEKINENNSRNSQSSLETETSESPKIWKDIETQFGDTKRSFGKKINFVENQFTRKIIFRDVEHACFLASSDYSKSAVILAGSVIEELLRLYLAHKNITPLSDNFDGYIRTCEQQRLLKDSVSRLTHSVRQFRNLVHLSAEKTKKYTISKATAVGAVSCIFTIANDF